MNLKTIKTMFLTAALFNWAVGLMLSIDAGLLFGLFSVSPAPAEPLFLQLFAGLVIVFGVGYFWASRDPAGNAAIIKLGILGKLSVFVVGVACVLGGAVSWQMILLVSVDLVYAILFWRSLKSL